MDINAGKFDANFFRLDLLADFVTKTTKTTGILEFGADVHAICSYNNDKSGKSLRQEKSLKERYL